MKLPRIPVLLLCLLMGCSRTPVSPDADRNQPSAVLPVAPTTQQAASPKKNDETMKDIAKPRENPEVVRNDERGIIRGVVRWEGAEPKPSSPRLRIDSATHGVADTAVWLVPADKTKKPVFPVTTVHLSAEQGEYRPHILLAQKGSTLEMRTVEDRADFQASGAASFSDTIRRGDWASVPLATPGLVEVRSQLEPQRMPAYIWVLDNISGTASGRDGVFRLPAMPPGEYELMLWHESWRSNEPTPKPLRVRITLGPHDGAEVRWTLMEKK